MIKNIDNDLAKVLCQGGTERQELKRQPRVGFQGPAIDILLKTFIAPDLVGAGGQYRTYHVFQTGRFYFHRFSSL